MATTHKQPEAEHDDEKPCCNARKACIGYDPVNRISTYRCDIHGTVYEVDDRTREDDQ